MNMSIAKKNTKLLSLMIIVIVCLVTLIIAEWGYMSLARQALFEDVNKVEVRGYEIDELPSIDLFQTSLDEYGEMVNRPLFVQGRRPIEPSDSGTLEPLVLSDFEHLLIGIYGPEEKMSALFKNVKVRGQEPKYFKVLVGDDIQGWQVDEIRRDKVILSQGDSQKQAMLHKPRPKQAPKKPRKKKLAKPNSKKKQQRTQ